MSATNKGELKFLTRQVVTDREYRPLEEIVNGSIHTTVCKDILFYFILY
jgi:hypothetical protein